MQSINAMTNYPPQGWNLRNTYATLPDQFYARIAPTPVKAPKLVIFNHVLAHDLGLDLKNSPPQELAQTFSGNQLPEGGTPIAQAYAGHQFGHFTMLGDGRAHLLGEQIAPDGKLFDIQFKGSGQTPYSRRGDGRAALAPMLREYLISEAMHALGIATTRSLAVVTTGEPVFRDTVLQGAILTRVAASHIRVATFEYAAAREDREGLQALADYAIARDYPELQTHEQPYLAFLNAVIARQAKLVASWMHVGLPPIDDGIMQVVLDKTADEILRLAKKRAATSQQLQVEKQHIKRLKQEMVLWEESQKIRTYVAAIRSGKSKPNKATKEWLAWAEQYADHLDPTVNFRIETREEI
jgi:uncharacterized protein YdiU (UPF0061 family)